MGDYLIGFKCSEIIYKDFDYHMKHFSFAMFGVIYETFYLKTRLACFKFCSNLMQAFLNKYISVSIDFLICSFLGYST